MNLAVASHRVRVILVFFAIACLAVSTIHAQQKIKEFTLEDLFTGNKFAGKAIRGFRWIEGGKAYSYLEVDTATKKSDIWRYDVASGKKSKLVSARQLVVNATDESFAIQNYVWSPNEKMILFTGTLAARSLKSGGNLFLYDLDRKSFRQLTDSREEQVNVKFSPDGLMIGYVRNSNIFVQNIQSGREIQLTTDGAEHVFNGKFDWVYEEEFSIIDGWQWSPDSKRIAYWQLDENRVPEFPIVDLAPLHNTVTRQRYPKAGDPNSIVRIGVVDLASKKTVWADIGAPPDSTQDTYVPRIQWTTSSNLLAVERLNRHQNQLDLTLVDASTGAATTVLTERDEAWLDVERDDLQFLKSGREFIWSSERDGYRHIYLFDMRGELVRQLTQGNWDIDRIYGVDEKGGRIYFSAAVISPMDREVYSVKLDGTGFRRLTKENGTNSANFSPDFSAFLHSFSDVNTPTKSILRKNDGTLIRIIEDGEIAALNDFKLSPKTFFTFKTTDGVTLNGWMIKPIDADPSKRYPVIMTVYGGPGSQTVQNSWGGTGFLWHQMMAQKGYMVVSVDNRGTGMRGRDFERVTYRNLGKWETNDQIEAARYLASLPYVDGTRIGIMGGSYGGYMTLMCMLQGADVFKAGIASSSVTSWKFYDTIYTERYMLTPEENPDGYKESAPLTHAAKLKGRLLIVHGTADDNVHLQNSTSMMTELIKHNKQFETAIFPGSKHGIRDRLYY